MAKEENIRIEGKVMEVLPSAHWIVELENSRVIKAYLGGKLRQHNINISLGDRVIVEMSAYDTERGRIVYRK
jgi:translation initiation factor IF-1